MNSHHDAAVDLAYEHADLQPGSRAFTFAVATAGAVLDSGGSTEEAHTAILAWCSPDDSEDRDYDDEEDDEDDITSRTQYETGACLICGMQVRWPDWIVFHLAIAHRDDTARRFILPASQRTFSVIWGGTPEDPVVIKIEPRRRGYRWSYQLPSGHQDNPIAHSVAQDAAFILSEWIGVSPADGPQFARPERREMGNPFERPF